MEVGYHVDSKIRLAHTAFKERVNCSFSSKYEVIDVTRDSSIDPLSLCYSFTLPRYKTETLMYTRRNSGPRNFPLTLN